MTRPLLQVPVLILRTWEDHNGKKQQQPHLIHNHRTDFLTDLRCNDTVVEVWQLLGTALLVEVVPFPACHHHRHLFHAVCTCEIILIIIIVFYALCIISPSFIAHSPLTQRQHKNSAETKAEEKKVLKERKKLANRHSLMHMPTHIRLNMSLNRHSLMHMPTHIHTYVGSSSVLVLIGSHSLCNSLSLIHISEPTRPP